MDQARKAHTDLFQTSTSRSVSSTATSPRVCVDTQNARAEQAADNSESVSLLLSPDFDVPKFFFPNGELRVKAKTLIVILRPAVFGEDGFDFDSVTQVPAFGAPHADELTLMATIAAQAPYGFFRIPYGFSGRSHAIVAPRLYGFHLGYLAIINIVYGYLRMHVIQAATLTKPYGSAPIVIDRRLKVSLFFYFLDNIIVGKRHIRNSRMVGTGRSELKGIEIYFSVWRVSNTKSFRIQYLLFT